MKHIKRIMTLCLSIAMVFSLIVASGVTTASALAGAGLQQTTFRSYGADISFWNVNTSSGNDYSRVDFAKMKADGCDYVILRIGYEGSASRQNTLDTAFVEYYKRARAAGMPMGVYFYQLGITYESAVEDAKWVIGIIEQYDMYFEYPIYYDVEDMGDLGDNPVGLGSAAMEQLCLGWCETLEAAGYFPGIYGGGWSVLDKLSADFKSKYDLWYAAYPSAQNPHLTTDKSGYCGMWQYAASGYNYDGVPASASLDVNVCYKDYPAIMKQYGYNNCGESEAKGALRSAVAVADNLRHYPYSNAQLTALRSAYDNAVSVLNNSASTDTACANAAATLNNAINNTSSILSTGKSYTVSANPRDDIWKDDGKRLTDGSKSNLPANTEAYSGLGTSSVDITVDLGANTGTHNHYVVHAAVNTGWGIAAPAEVKVSVSSDGSKFTEVATTATAYATAQSADWTSYVFNAHAEYTFAERYVRFTVVPNGSKHIWLDEVTVGNSDDTVRNGVYINGINEKIEAGDCHVFTPDFGEITTATANHTWTRNVIVKWDSEAQMYKVQSVSYGIGAETPAVTLSSGELLIAAHSWEGEGVEDPIAGSSANCALLATLQEGDLVSFSGVSVANGSIAPASYMSIPKSNTDTGVTDPEPTPVNDNLALNKTYTTSDIYAADGAVLYPDENGVTLTDGKIPANDASFSDAAFVGFNANSEDYKTNGYSSITVDLGKVYAVDKFVANVATEYNFSAGIYAPAEISVYVSEDNGTWTKAGSVNPVDTNTVSTVAATIELDKSVSARYVQFRIVAEKSWMFVSEIEVYEGEPVVEPTPSYIIGDVDNSGTVDSLDYLLVKRHCFSTYTLSDDEYVRANADKSETVDSVDYVLIKRIAFGTYSA